MACEGIQGEALAKRLGCCYEQVRKMTRGEVLPSPALLRKLCTVFGWSVRKLSRFVMMDHARKSFGDSFWRVLGRNPKCEVIYILWQFLSEAEKDYFTACLKQLVAQKQASQRKGDEATLA